MLYALKDNKKSLATSTGERATCPFTGSEMIAKCGPIKINHWAYKVAPENFNYKPETDWHLGWKKMFLPEFCEILHTAPNGTKYVADVDTGATVVEFQHSSLRSLTLLETELLYTTLNRSFIWLLDGNTFLSSIEESSNKDYSDFTLKYCTTDQREYILNYHAGRGNRFKIEDKYTDFYNIDLSGKNLFKIQQQLKDYQKLEDIRLSKEGLKVLILKSRKSIFTLSRSPIYIDISFKVKDSIYDVQNNEVITKDEFVRLCYTYKRELKTFERHIEI